MVYVIVFAVSALASFIQAVTGFGAAIVMMLFFSFFMPITKAAALNGILCIGSNISNSISYRKHIKWKTIIIPACTYFIFAFAAIYLAKSMDTSLLKKLFGIILILLSIYFVFIAKNLKIKANPVSSIICGTISGITGGLFSASAPPLVPYFLSAAKSKEEYIGTLQIFCLISGLWSFGIRLANDFYSADMIPMIILGIGGVLIGQFIGIKAVHKISAEHLRTIVYIMLAISGIIYLI